MRRTRCWYTKRRSELEMFMASDRPLGRSEKTETLEAIPPAELDRLQQVELSLKGLKGRIKCSLTKVHPPHGSSLWESALRSQWARASPDVRSDQNIIARR